MEKQVYIIAEIAQAHDGSLGILHSYIDALQNTGIDAIKFQTHIAKSESSDYESFRIPFSYVDKSRFDYWKRMEFTSEQWQQIKIHCEAKNIEFLSSPFSNAAVDLLEQLNVAKYKIPSGEVTNYLLLEKIKRTKKPIILSSGLSTIDELSESVSFLGKEANLSILQCTTSYPTSSENIGLSYIPYLFEKFNVPIGLSDHSGKIFPSLAAVAIGARIIEVHAVFDRRMFGPDSTSSLLIDEIKELVDGIRFIENACNREFVKGSDIDEKNKLNFSKSLKANKFFKKGHIVEFADLEAAKPGGMGIQAKSFQELVGKISKRDIKENEFLKYEDFQ